MRLCTRTAAGLAGLSLCWLPVLTRAAQPSCRLAYDFKPGMELVYRIEAGLKYSRSSSAQDMASEMHFAGSARVIVAEVDEATGIALVGNVGTGNWTTVAGGQIPGGTMGGQAWVAVYRVDKTGNPIDRKTTEAKQAWLQRMLAHIGTTTQSHAPFPTTTVTNGSKWTGKMTLPVPGMRPTASAESTVTAIEVTGDRKSCRVKSTFAVEPGSMTGMENMEMTGTGETLLDLERKIGLERNVELAGKFGGLEFDMEMQIRNSAKLESYRILTGDEVSDWSRRVKILDSVVNKIYGNKLDDALAALEQQKKIESLAAWRDGLESTLQTVKKIQQFSSSLARGTDMIKEGAGPELKLVKQAELAARSQQWRKAVDRYKELVQKYPEHHLAPQALVAAATICEHRLKDKQAAAELRKKLVRIREQKSRAGQSATAGPAVLYRLASAYAQAGQVDKAVATYEKVARTASTETSGRIKVLAQYRAACLLDKNGQHARALAAYRASIAIDTNDDYADRIKDKARTREKELAAAAE